VSAGPDAPDEPVALSGEKVRMFPGERRRQILEIVNARGSIRVSELATLVRVTEPTVRKDISDLDAIGTVSQPQRLIERRLCGTAPAQRAAMVVDAREKALLEHVRHVRAGEERASPA